MGETRDLSLKFQIEALSYCSTAQGPRKKFKREQEKSGDRSVPAPKSWRAHSPDTGVVPLCKLSLKTREITRPDSLPHAPHGVKEEREVVLRQQYARQHFARIIKMTQVCARVSAAD